MKIILLIILSWVFLGIPITVNSEEAFTGKIYLAGSNRTILLFQQKNSTLKKDGKSILRHTYTDSDGKTAVIEDVIFENGSFIEYHVEFADTECGCKLKRNGNKLKFGFTRGDTSKSGEDDYYQNLVMGPTLTSFIKANWNPMESGETVYFYLPAMTLMRVAKFRMFRHDDSPYNRPGVIVFKMDLSNFFLRPFVDPVDLVYDVKTKRLTEIHGKSLLRRKVNGKTENPVVDIYYTYKN